MRRHPRHSYRYYGPYYAPHAQRRAPSVGWLGVTAAVGFVGLMISLTGTRREAALRYIVLYIDQHAAYLESENHGTREVPLDWLPKGIKEGQLLLVEPRSGKGASSARFAVLAGDFHRL